MKTYHQLAAITFALLLSTLAFAQDPPKMKMTTPVPEGLATPDTLETSLGALTSFDGVPDAETTQKVYDNLDLNRATEAFLNCLPIASMNALEKGALGFGPANSTAMLFEDLMDSKALWLTPNTTSVYMHFYATGITPAMAIKNVGKGSQYAIAYLDKDGNALDGSKTYKINLPPNVPAKDFWSFTLYDNQTRAMLQTDQRFPGLDDSQKGLKENADGSYDIYFAPKPPKGQENNWIQTVPVKGWNTILRLYGPLDPFYDKTWKPGDPELVE